MTYESMFLVQKGEANEMGFYPILVTTGEYRGVEFVFKNAWFEDDQLCFTFDVTEGKIEDGDTGFRELLSGYMMQLLSEVMTKDQDEN